MAPIDMSDEDAAEFDARHATLEKIRSTPKGAAFLSALEGIAEEAVRDVVAVAEVLAPIALEGGKALLVSLVSAAIDKGISKLTK